VKQETSEGNTKWVWYETGEEVFRFLIRKKISFFATAEYEGLPASSTIGSSGKVGGTVKQTIQSGHNRVCDVFVSSVDVVVGCTAHLTTQRYSDFSLAAQEPNRVGRAF
jgi:hypothetical protein